MPALDKTGKHYEVTVLRIEYKNSDNIETKRLFYDQQREKARDLFKENKYADCIKIYKKLINVTENISRRIYSEEEIVELENMNINSKKNYLKAFFKLDDK